MAHRAIVSSSSSLSSCVQVTRGLSLPRGLYPSCCGCSSPAGKTAESDRSNGKKFLPTKLWYRTATSIDLNARVAALQFIPYHTHRHFTIRGCSPPDAYGSHARQFFEAPVLRSASSSKRQFFEAPVLRSASSSKRQFFEAPGLLSAKPERMPPCRAARIAAWAGGSAAPKGSSVYSTKA